MVGLLASEANKLLTLASRSKRYTSLVRPLVRLPLKYSSVPVKLDESMSTNRRGTKGIKTQWSLPADCRSGKNRHLTFKFE